MTGFESWGAQVLVFLLLVWDIHTKLCALFSVWSLHGCCTHGGSKLVAARPSTFLSLSPSVLPNIRIWIMIYLAQASSHLCIKGKKNLFEITLHVSLLSHMWSLKIYGSHLPANTKIMKQNWRLSSQLSKKLHFPSCYQQQTLSFNV